MSRENPLDILRADLASNSHNLLSRVNEEQRSLLHTTRELDLLLQETEARKCLKDTFYWLSKGTKTIDRQNLEDPMRPFPDRPYFSPIFQFLNDRRINRGNKTSRVGFFKSRTMMTSWLVSGYIAHLGFNNAAVQVLIQSEDEARAVEIIDNIKILWINSSDALKTRWKVRKDPDSQPYNRFELENKSTFISIAGGANKIRSYHPTIYFADEAAFMDDLEDCISNAAATRCHQIILVSTAYPGYMADLWEECKQVDWSLKGTT